MIDRSFRGEFEAGSRATSLEAISPPFTLGSPVDGPDIQVSRDEEVRRCPQAFGDGTELVVGRSGSLRARLSLVSVRERRA